MEGSYDDPKPTAYHDLSELRRAQAGMPDDHVFRGALAGTLGSAAKRIAEAYLVPAVESIRRQLHTEADLAEKSEQKEESQDV